MDRPTVYIETSVVSYLAARPSRHPATARKQALTHAWWARRERYALVTSTIVIEEAGCGNPVSASQRLKLLERVTPLEQRPEVDPLARALLRHGGIPARAANDAKQIALAAVYALDYLLSWDRAHITNGAIRPRMERICRSHGYELPVLCPPHMLP